MQLAELLSTTPPPSHHAPSLMFSSPPPCNCSLPSPLAPALVVIHCFPPLTLWPLAISLVVTSSATLVPPCSPLQKVVLAFCVLPTWPSTMQPNKWLPFLCQPMLTSFRPANSLYRWRHLSSRHWPFPSLQVAAPSLMNCSSLHGSVSGAALPSHMQSRTRFFKKKIITLSYLHLD
ncbi:hypothetical protein GOP47_0027986 [Adiantum capillus-veneris]|nr:hypothetical protein GOP47_0027986 [Adiantum capillus-veneris]